MIGIMFLIFAICMILAIPVGFSIAISATAFLFFDAGIPIFSIVQKMIDGINSFSYIKDDICAVICDRLHPDGTTLRHSRDRYLQFYDAKDIMDVAVRPQREIDWA